MFRIGTKLFPKRLEDEPNGQLLGAGEAKVGEESSIKL